MFWRDEAAGVDRHLDEIATAAGDDGAGRDRSVPRTRSWSALGAPMARATACPPASLGLPSSTILGRRQVAFRLEALWRARPACPTEDHRLPPGGRERALGDRSLRRGLEARGSICVDGGAGLLAALPMVARWAHKIRNVLGADRRPRPNRPRGTVRRPPLRGPLARHLPQSRRLPEATR